VQAPHFFFHPPMHSHPSALAAGFVAIRLSSRLRYPEEPSPASDRTHYPPQVIFYYHPVWKRAAP